MTEIHPPTRLLVLRERDTLLHTARTTLDAERFREVEKELEQALSLPDDEATLVMATIKGAWGL
jgi:predicted negative regulator of RcsB-dependent stress response